MEILSRWFALELLPPSLQTGPDDVDAPARCLDRSGFGTLIAAWEEWYEGVDSEQRSGSLAFVLGGTIPKVEHHVAKEKYALLTREQYAW